jgi:erythromycin esterase-like protein
MQTVLLDAIRREAHAVTGDDDHDFLLERIGGASTVLLGEATHGTQEFYRLRAAISRRLIVERGFDAIAVEADWPDALRVSRYVSAKAGRSADRTARDALGDFVRFPQWMWRNTEMLEQVDWLRTHNAQRASSLAPVGFFGLDLYSLRSSMQAVISYLAQVDPEAARQARARYACFDHMAEDPQRYGYAASFGMKKDCEDEVVRQLMDLSARAQQAIARPNPEQNDELFYAQQNARVAQNAEAYYRTMYAARDESWNLRDTHMAETLAALREHLSQRKGAPAKIIVWAHNSHIGDARATEMGHRGQLNLGQLVRENKPQGGSFLLGFTTHTGSVTAASEWDGPAKEKKVRPSLSDSYENLFHQAGMPRFVLPLGRASCLHEMAARNLQERAIGVLYLPRSERASHYFEADMASQFDAVLHVDETHALRPLDADSYAAEPESPETFPSGL